MDDELLKKIMLILQQEKVLNLADIEGRIRLLLYDYDICKKEVAISVCTQGKNEVCIQRFLLAKATAGCTNRTIEQYQNTIDRVLQKIGKDVDKITPLDIQVYLAKLMTQGITKGYCDTVRRYLNTFFAYLHREDLVPLNPMLRIEKIKYHREKETAFSDIEIERMRAACKTSFEKAVFEILLSTGCRAAEACSMLKSDIKNDEISILGKGEKYRTVYLTAKARLSLESYLNERTDGNPYVFPGGLNLKDDNRIAKLKGNWFKYPDLVHPTMHYSGESINTLMRRIGKRAGVEKVHAHRFRRTCATQALRRGMPIEIVSMMLGHEQLNTTQIYLDIREDDLKEAHRKFVS